MYEVPGSGRHHKRRRRHVKETVSGRNSIRLAKVDIAWMMTVAFALPGLVAATMLPYAPLWIATMLTIMVSAVAYRLLYQSGGRHYGSGPRDDEPEAEDQPGEPEPVPVYDVEVVPMPEEVRDQARVHARTLAAMATVSGALLAFARHSQRQADKSRHMHDEIDEQLGLPGTRLGYGPQYQQNRPPIQTWEQPVITGLNWQERQERQIRDGHIRQVGGEPGKTDGSWQNG